MKEEKGAITLFVLVSCMFMVVILLVVNIGVMNKNRSQEKNLEEIAKQYSQNETDLNNAYISALDENIDPVVAQLANAMYPVGSIYISTNSRNPGEYLGGEWKSFGEGKTIVGVDSSDVDFATVKSTGGEQTHKLTAEEMPSHSHTFSVVTGSAGAHTHGTGDSTWTHFAIANNDKITRRLVYGGSGTNKGYTWTTDSKTSYSDMGSTNSVSSAGAHTHTVSGTTAGTGSGSEHNNMQPYIVTYMWERIK